MNDAVRIDTNWHYHGLRALVVDLAIGFAIAAPVYWMFTQFLAISLPGLTASGWI